MRRNSLWILAALCILLLLAYENTHAQIDPEFDSASMEAIDMIYETNNLHGVTMAVVLPDGRAWVGARGFSDRRKTIAMAPDNLLRIASNTKTFVATTICQLAEEGVLELEDSVEKCLPGLVPNGENITIRHLLTHTSGLYNYTDVWGEITADRSKIWQPEEIINFATARGTNFSPGSNYRYCNTGYVLLGMIIEKATGSLIEKEIRRRFLEPLNLNNTFYAGAEAIPETLALNPSAPDPYTAVETSVWAAGAIVSSAEDLARWAQELYGGRILKQSSLDAMLDPGTYGYGLGVMGTTNSLGIGCGHLGGMYGYISAMYYFPDVKTSIVVLVNQQSGSSQQMLSSAANRMSEFKDLLPFEPMDEEEIPPAAVLDLTETDVLPNTDSILLSSLHLTWTASGDDGNNGRAYKYDVRYSITPISDDNYYSCQLLLNMPTPKTSGSKEDFEVDWLAPGTYYFALKAIDDAYNYSDISNVVMAELPRNLFYRTAEESGLAEESAMAAVLDYNDDGYLDILLVDEGLYLNNGDGTFSDVSSETQVRTSRGVSSTTADYDDDGDIDIYVVMNRRENRLFWNHENKVFLEQAEDAGLNYEGDCISACSADYDCDGDLDIFVVDDDSTNLLYRNKGDGTFTDVSSTVEFLTQDWVKSALFFDYDGDGDQDCYLVGIGGFLYQNQGNGTFLKVEKGISHQIEEDDVCYGDYDNDGDFDLFIVSKGDPSYLFRNDGNASFTDVSAEAGVDEVMEAKAANFLDFDNDGDLDIYVVNYREPDVLYVNNGNGTFSRRADMESASSSPGQSAAFADFDNDGFVDIYVVNLNEAGELFLNNTGDGNWLHVKVMSAFSNTCGIGARVTVVSEGLEQIREVCAGSGQHSDSLPVEFGLGKRTRVDMLRVDWPSGKSLVLNDVSVNQLLTVEEPGGGILPVTWAKVKSELLPNFPNPSNPETWIPYRLAQETEVNISIYDIKGQLVRLLSLGTRRVGEHVDKENAAYWDGRNTFGESVASGIYFYTLQAGEYRATRKMAIIR